MEATFYYKNVTIDGKRYKFYMRNQMSNEDFSDLVGFVRRIFSYAMYPRWLAAKMLLGDTYVMLRKKGCYKHRIRKAFNQLNKEFDAFEKLHKMDFDQDWIEVMSGSMATQLQPKITALRGSLGGIMMNLGIKNYILYSYPQAALVLAREGTEYHDALIKKVRERWGVDFTELYQPLRGDKVLGCCRSLMSAIEDTIGEELPKGVDATGTPAEIALRSLERAFYDDNMLAKAFNEAEQECKERDFNSETIANKLSEKFNVKKL